MLGVAGIIFITLFQTLTNTDEHNSQLLKEVTEAAMWDAVDYAYYREKGVYKIQKEKFAENFIRRFAESANTSSKYQIKIYDVNELPPKVSVDIITNNISGNVTAALGDDNEVTLTTRHRIDAILETPY